MELEPKRELEHGLSDVKMELVVVLYFSTVLARTQGVVYKVSYEEVKSLAFHRWTF